MRVDLKYSFLLPAVVLISTVMMTSCLSHDEEVRMPDNILGVWSPSENIYLEFEKDYTLHKLEIVYQDDISIGLWSEDAYLYEPGYNLVIYLNGISAQVYEVVSLTSSKLTWCPVKTINIEDAENADSVGKILGEVIKEAQEGFHLDPELYVTYNKVSEDRFFSIIESLGLDYPWW